MTHRSHDTPARSSTAPIVRRALGDAFRQARPAPHDPNPVMFVVEVGSAFTTLLFVHAADRPATARRRRRLHPGASRSGSGSRCSSRTSPRRWPRAAARRRPTRCARRARTSSRKRLAEPGARRRGRDRSSRRSCAPGDVVLVEAGELDPGRRRDHRGRRLGRRERDHRRERAGDPRERRRPQRGHRRHARALRLARRPHHARTRARPSSTA